MHADVTRLDLRLRRRSLLGYTAGMALYALIIVALYPQFKDSVSLNQITKNGSAVAALFGATGSLTSPAGWLDTNIYVNFLPLIMLLDHDRLRGVVHRRPGRGRHPVPRRRPPHPAPQHPAPEGRDPGHPGDPARPGDHGVRRHRPRIRPERLRRPPRRDNRRRHPPRNRLRPPRRSAGLPDRATRHGHRHNRDGSRGLLPDQLARPRGRMDPASPVRLPVLLVRRKRPAQHRAHRRLHRRTRQRSALRC